MQLDETCIEPWERVQPPESSSVCFNIFLKSPSTNKFKRLHPRTFWVSAYFQGRTVKFPGCNMLQHVGSFPMQMS